MNNEIGNASKEPDGFKVQFESILHHDINTVWKAITNKDKMKQWYFDIPDFKLEVGHEFIWWAGPPNGKQWEHNGKIIEVIEKSKLVHSWSYQGYKGETVVFWELSKIDKNKTHLLFIHEIIIPFPEDEEALKQENFVDGWNQIINTSLKEFLEK